MKKLFLAAMFLVMGAVCVFADDGIYFNIGKLDFVMPFKTTSVTAFYDFATGTGRNGIQTPLANYGILSLGLGAVTDMMGKGSPYVSLNADLARMFPKLLPGIQLPVGLLGGEDFQNKKLMYGIILSVPFTIY